mgnify:FL=1
MPSDRECNFAEVASVIDGKTGNELSVDAYFEMSNRRRENRKASRFIKGPLPVKTIAVASEISPAALQVALVLFFLHGLTGKKRFRAEAARFEELNVSTKSRQRGLKALEKRGLILVHRASGKVSEVTLLKAFL